MGPYIIILDRAGSRREEKQGHGEKPSLANTTVSGRELSAEQRRPPDSGRKGKSHQHPALELAPQGAHPWAPLLCGHSGGPQCGWTRPAPSAGTRSRVYTGATDLSTLTHILPSKGQVHSCLFHLGYLEPHRTPEADLWSINTQICPGWTREVGPAGTTASRTPCFCLRFPIQQPSPSSLIAQVSALCFSSPAKSPGVLWSLTSYFN